MHLLYLTSHRLRLTPQGKGAEPFDEIFDVARPGQPSTAEAPIFVIRPVNMAELDQAYSLAGARSQTAALATLGVVEVDGQPTDGASLSYGVQDALVSAILAVSRGPLDLRRPSTPAADASLGQS